MHYTADQSGRMFFDCYANSTHKRVLDIGAMDVNGSLRRHAPSFIAYVGMDIEAGPGVDVVNPPGNPFPFDADTFDLAVSTSYFEHDQCFWFTFTEAIRTLKAGGHFFLNAPSNGPYHGYPFDNWRFYPDAARALVAWAERGYQVRVVESGTLRQVAGSCARLARMVRLGAVPDRCRVPVCLDRLFGGRHPQPAASRSGALGSGASRSMPCTHY
jgi:SAM-dependent methyltransferase